MPINEEIISKYKKFSNPVQALSAATSFASPKPNPSFFLAFLNIFLIVKNKVNEITTENNEFNIPT